MSGTKQLIEVIGPYVNLYRNPITGIAWIEDGHTGCGHSCHPNIDASGSAKSMKARGFWSEDDQVVTTNGFKYNISQFIVSTNYDLLAAKHCQCRPCLLNRVTNLQAEVASLRNTLRDDLSRDAEIFQEIILLDS